MWREARRLILVLAQVRGHLPRPEVTVGSDMRIGFRTVDGLQIRFAESDSSSSRCLVLTSPWPESLLAFERVWVRLSAAARLITATAMAAPASPAS